MNETKRHEKQAIIAYLDVQCERIDKITDKLNDEIALFVEYRTRLISDAVTGKLDVRGLTVPEYEVMEDVAGDELKAEEMEDSDNET